MNPDPPPYRKLAATLRTTTERLARELATPVDEPPEWSAFEWDVARAVAAMHGISALLANRLRWRGPLRWQDFLHEQLRQGLLRDHRVGEVLAQLDQSTRREAVGVVSLKGSALRTLEIYAPGERPMGDIDLYTPPATFPAAARAIEALGYREAFRMSRHVVYRCGSATTPHGAGEHIDNPLKIELHERIAEPLPVSLVDITARLPPTPLEHGVQGYRSRAALMAHLLLHAAGNMRANALRLLQLHDIARLSLRMDAHDWRELADEDNETSWWVYPPLLLATKYCEIRVPPKLLQSLERACPRMLALAARRTMLTDVSWSNLRIGAFPGIEWSRSALEAMRFAKSRFMPSKDMLDVLSIAQHEQPQFAAVPWYAQSHAVRIARWLFGRPPRVQTMSSVLAALGDR